VGHGWIVPNRDKRKVKCGGPALCGECAQELANLSVDSTGDLEQIVAWHPNILVRRLATIILQEKKWAKPSSA
jgi:hypothetical protein